MNISSLKKSWQIVNRLGMNSIKVYLNIFIYYILTIINALLEGIGLVIIVDLFTGKSTNGNFNNSLLIQTEEYLSNNFDVIISTNIILLLITFLLFSRIITFGIILITEGYFHALVRRAIQSYIFKNYILGQWEYIRNVRVGHAVNLINTESIHLEKYYFSILKAIYYFLTTVLLMSVAMIIDFKITLMLIAVSLPCFLFLNYLLRIQTKVATKYAETRNTFAADVSERISGSIQIQVEGSQKHHIATGLRTQPLMQRLEILLGYISAGLNIFMILLPFIIFLIILILSIYTKIDINLFLSPLAIIGIIGVRAITQLNAFIANIGSISRHEGSLKVINDALKIEKILKKEKITNELIGIKSSNLNYDIDGKSIIKNMNFEITKGNIFVIQGKSGSGKSTIANLISGIIVPTSGIVEYISNKNEFFNANIYDAKIGYVTQDIHLFKGTFRENLVNDKVRSNNEIWKVLEQVGADEFIKKNGGLDSQILEAGRSLSGGQKRRLGIARVLLMKSNIIIFDEITAGLDQENSKLIQNLIEDLSRESIVIMISHEKVSIDSAIVFELYS